MIHVFLHVPKLGHYREVVAELSGEISGSGLYDAADRLTVVTTGRPVVADLLGSRWTIDQTAEGVESFEYPTLRKLWRVAQEAPQCKCLYLHCKAVSHHGHQRVRRDAWRRYMAYHVVGKWRECVDLLNEYETVGTERRDPPEHSPMHYAGNFWWVRGDYLATLPEPVPVNPEPVSLWRGVRYGAETWLLGSSDHVAPYSFQQLGYKFWRETIPEGLYRGA